MFEKCKVETKTREVPWRGRGLAALQEVAVAAQDLSKVQALLEARRLPATKVRIQHENAAVELPLLQLVDAALAGLYHMWCTLAEAP